MRYIYRFLTVAVVLALLMGIGVSTAFAQDPDQGKRIWAEVVWQCQRCHGPAGEGAWGPTLAGNKNPVEDWISQVRAPRRSMPTFSPQQVSDEQITDIHAYLTSLPEPATAALPDAGLPADAPAGQMLLVEKRCVACHTTTGPINIFIERGEIPTAEAVIAQLRSPRHNMPMFSEGQVSDADATLIADFLAQQVSSQLAPATLPTSGGDQSSKLPLFLALIGSGLVTLGLILRRGWAAH
jgi:mono/diheme cytochrome c family protein